MTLSVGITEWLPQWRILLSQTGLPVKKVNLDGPLEPELYGAVIVSSRMGHHRKDSLVNYLNRGGAVLVEADVAEWLLGIQTFPSFVKYVDPMDDPVFNGVVPGSLDARLLVPRQAALLKSDTRKPLVQILDHGSGVALILPGMLSGTALDTRSRRRNFPTSGPWLPSERVSRRSKNTLRTIVERSLEHLFFQRGLPMVSLSPVPNGESTLFAFRVDTDFAPEKAIEDLAALCKQHNIPATWFVETASARDYLKRFAELNHHNVGIHCYRHRVFRDYVRNERDIFHAVRLLSLEKFRTQGYASPFGLWNTSLAKALEHHGFVYSSEFSLDYDNLPFYPFLGDRFSTVLQVPVHPITTGHLRNARHSDEDMKAYWRNRIEDHMRFQLPLIAYDHPSQANLEVLNWLFNEIHERNIPTLSFLEYARWWIQRASATWAVELEDDTLHIDSSIQDSSIWLNIRKSPMEQARTEMSKSIDLRTLDWQTIDPALPERTPIAQRRMLNRKMIMNEILSRYWRIKSGRRGDEERG